MSRIVSNEVGDKEFLEWVYDRLVNMHGENPSVDYMQKLQEFVDQLAELEEALGKLGDIKTILTGE